MSRFSDLPSELLDIVAGHLANSHYYPSLEATALTCKAFVIPSQIRIFHSVDLWYPSLVEKWLKVLTNAPHTRNYVKRITITELNKHWSSTCVAFDQALDLLAPCSVVTLVIFRRAHLSKYPRLDLPAIEKLVSLQKITCHEEPHDGLALTGDYSLVTLCNRFSRLRSLELRSISKNTLVNTSTPATLPIFTLQTLQLGSALRTYRDQCTIEWLLATSTSLRTLYIPFDRDVLPRFISTLAGNSLNELHIENISRSPENKQGLSELVTSLRTSTPNLCTLVLGTTTDMVEGALRVAASTLASPLHPILQRLTFNFDVHAENPSSDICHDLETIVLNRTYFPALKYVGLVHALALSNYKLDDEIAEEWEERVRSLFPRLASERMLLVKRERITDYY